MAEPLKGHAAVGVVVLNHNNYPSVLSTLESVRSQADARLYVQLVDNGNEFAPPEHVFPAADSVLQLASNDGYADGMNRGLLSLPIAEFDYVLLLTHDVEFCDDRVLSGLIAYMDSHSEAGVCGPALRSPAGEFWSGGGLLTRWTWRGYHRPILEIPATVDVDWLDGSCLLYRPAALFAAGMFDTSFFLYVEELEHHYRLRKAGWRVRCVQELVATQATNGSPPYLGSRNQIMFLRKHGQVLRALLASGRLVVKATRLALDSDERKNTRSVLTGMAHGWRGRSRGRSPGTDGKARG